MPQDTAILAAKDVKLLKNWGGKRESNPQPPEPQSGALPVELFPPQALIIAIAIQESRTMRQENLAAALCITPNGVGRSSPAKSAFVPMFGKLVSNIEKVQYRHCMRTVLDIFAQIFR